MRDDLLDAKAAIDWAISQVPILVKRVVSWRQDRPYTIVIDADSKPGKKIYRLANIKGIDPLINAEAGAILHSFRSSLDLLACVLAARNGYPDSATTYFPIWKSEAAFLCAPGRKTNPVLEKIKRLSQVDQIIIKDLKPYPGGNDRLVALHELDLTRKHRRLLNTFVFPRGIGLDGFGYSRIGNEITLGDWHGFDEKTVLMETDAAVPDGNVTVGLHVALDEASPINGRDLGASLRDFASLAYSIINIFDT